MTKKCFRETHSTIHVKRSLIKKLHKIKKKYEYVSLSCLVKDMIDKFEE